MDDDFKLPKLVPDMKALSERFISEPTLKTMTSSESEQANSGEAAVCAGNQEQIKGFMVEGDLFAGYGLYHKAIEQYRRISGTDPEPY